MFQHMWHSLGAHPYAGIPLALVLLAVGAGFAYLMRGFISTGLNEEAAAVIVLVCFIGFCATVGAGAWLMWLSVTGIL